MLRGGALSATLLRRCFHFLGAAEVPAAVSAATAPAARSCALTLFWISCVSRRAARGAGLCEVGQRCVQAHNLLCTCASAVSSFAAVLAVNANNNSAPCPATPCQRRGAAAAFITISQIGLSGNCCEVRSCCV